MTSLSIYDSEQYIFEIAQNFIRSRILFTSFELKIFELLLSHSNGLTCSELARELNLHWIDNQSRCFEDILDCLTAMNFLERNDKTCSYQLTKLTRNYLLPHRTLLTQFDQQFYQSMPHCHQHLLLDSSTRTSIHQLLLTRIQQYIDLTPYSNISIDSFDENTNAIILWRQDGCLKEKIQQAYEILPSQKKGLLILIIPQDEQDEITLALNLLSNMSQSVREEENVKDFYSKKYLKQIGFRSIERIQTLDDLQLLLAHK